MHRLVASHCEEASKLSEKFTGPSTTSKMPVGICNDSDSSPSSNAGDHKSSGRKPIASANLISKRSIKPVCPSDPSIPPPNQKRPSSSPSPSPSNATKSPSSTIPSSSPNSPTIHSIACPTAATATAPRPAPTTTPSSRPLSPGMAHASPDPRSPSPNDPPSRPVCCSFRSRRCTLW